MPYSQIDRPREEKSLKSAHKFAARKMIEVKGLKMNLTESAEDSMRSIFFRWGFETAFDALGA